jgi:hypothetical protein
MMETHDKAKVAAILLSFQQACMSYTPLVVCTTLQPCYKNNGFRYTVIKLTADAYMPSWYRRRPGDKPSPFYPYSCFRFRATRT